MPETATLCPYCGVGCGLLVEVREGRVARVRGDPAHPSSLGDVCAKAVHLPPTLRTAERLLYPHVRARRDGALARVPWELAVRTVADRLGEIVVAHGPDAIAFYASGQLTTEEYYVAGKLAKGFLRTNNFDTNSRLCMASAAVGYTRSFGADGPPCSYEDIDAADLFLLVGANVADCHPVLFKRLRRRKAAAPGDVSVIVADPRWTETADVADLHLPLRPGSDVALLNGMLHVLARDGLLDRGFIAAHTADWAVVEREVAAYTPERAARLTGLSPEAIVAAAMQFAGARRALTLWSMGVNQSRIGTDKTTAILNLHLATGQIGRPGAGPFSLTGQPNAMGGRETGGLAHLLPGYRAIGDADARAAVEKHWGVEPGTIQPQPGRAALEIFEGLTTGEVRAVWILCTNPAASMPDTDLVERALRQADLVIVQDAYHPTETTRFADVLLPAAQWPEKDGVMTNSERRLTYLPRLVAPPGEALPDAEILMRVAAALGFKASFAYESAADIFDDFAALTAGRPCDYSGLSHSRLRSRTPEPIVEVNVADALRAGIQDGDFVELASRRGKVIAQCRVTSAIREGVCFAPFHWGRRLGFYKSANNLTLSARDPLSRQPELKACAVRLRRVEAS